MSEQLSNLAAKYWERVLSANPTLATFYGVHDYDDRLEDLSIDAEQDFRSDLVSIRTQVEALASESLSMNARVTKSLLLNQIDTKVEAIDLRLIELASDHMDGPHAQLLMAAPLLTYPETEHAEAALDRYAQIPRMLGQALDRFRDGLKVGRTPVAAVIARSLNSLDRYLETDLDQDPFLAASVPVDWSGREGWLATMRDLVSDQIRPAIAVYRNVLAEELLPLGRDEDHAGICWLPDGDQIYEAQIHAYTSTRISAGELHERGRWIIENKLPGEYTATASSWFASLGSTAPTFDPADSAVLHEYIRNAPGLRHSDAQQIIDVAESSIERAERAIPEYFGRLPLARCVVSPVPDFLAADSPYAYYFPAAPDGTRPGTYFINTASPEEASLAEAQSIAFHEAIPGHHLQIAIGQELTGVPEFQKHEGNTAFIEGWALYAERLADQMNLYSDDVARIGMLAADSWRSARLVVDTGLHALGWSRQQAIEYFEVNTPVPVDQIATEVDRYIAIPGQALAYKVGQLEIERLRDQAMERLGEDFSIKDFHDTVLGSGAVTLPVLAELIEAYSDGT
ncbi:MAG: DUF885 domain-containing protein [Microthrixaceae bacterium]|nr:DUF885 domain-containing protein [Microthrixaceae bacterium]